MAYYLWTGSYSPEAKRAMIKNPQNREVAAQKVIEAAGGKLHHMFAMMGSSDVIVLAEFPDEIGMAAVSLAVGATGSIAGGATTRLLTMSEFSEAMERAGEISELYSPPKG